MKLLFVHGGEKLKEDKNGELYTGGSYNKEVWNRYLDISENLTVIARKELTIYDAEYAKRKFQPFNKNRINFIEVPNLTSSYSSFLSVKKRKNTNKLIEKKILENDCLIARLPSRVGYLAIKYAKKHNKPYFVEVVGCAWDALWNHSLKGKILALKSYLAMKDAIKDAPYAIYVTNEFLQRRYPCKGKTIGCSDVLLPLTNNNVLAKRLYKIDTMDESKPIILGTIGAVNVIYKGQEYVIKAISKLNKKGYNFEYHLIGGGDNSHLMKIAKKNNVVDKVKFLGSLPHEKVFEYLDNIDIYIQPSKTEGLPRSLLEAMSRGCPAIGSDAGGIPELISSEFVFVRRNINDLEKKLMNMDKAIMIEEATKNFNKAKEFDKDLLDERRNDFYKYFIERVKNND